eukprot:COSAG02_NODE_362_length_23815_cov_27.096981_4_plen_57_part_00
MSHIVAIKRQRGLQSEVARVGEGVYVTIPISVPIPIAIAIPIGVIVFSRNTCNNNS